MDRKNESLDEAKAPVRGTGIGSFVFAMALIIGSVAGVIWVSWLLSTGGVEVAEADAATEESAHEEHTPYTLQDWRNDQSHPDFSDEEIGLSSRFVEVLGSPPSMSEGQLSIIVDSETGVSYLWKQYGNRAGLTVLVDADGKPLLDPEYVDERSE